MLYEAFYRQFNESEKHSFRMKHFFAAILFAAFVAALANPSVKLKKSTDSDAKKVAQGIMNFYAGSNCKNMEQQLADIKTEIKALKGNQTCGSGGKGLSPEVKQQLVDMNEEIRNLRQNLTGGPAGNELFSDVKQQLAEIKQNQITRALKGNQTGGEVKQQLVDMKEEIRNLRQNLTVGPAGNELFSEVKQQLAEIKQVIRALKGNQTGGCGGKGLYLNSTLLLI